MESLLRWSIENSTGNAGGPPSERKDLDPGIIDAILGKPDAEQMKEDLAIALDVLHPEDERVSALDHLEMLIEHIDNANDLSKLQMWQPLHGLLTDKNSSNKIKMQTLWVIGTALQNNPAAQDSYLSLNPTSVLISLLSSSDSDTAVRSKVIYALSGLLKHNSTALKTIDPYDWLKLRDALQDPDISVRRKVAFLFNTLLLPSQPNEQPVPSVPIHANSHVSHIVHPERTVTSPLARSAMAEHQIASKVIDSLINPLPFGEDGDSEGPDPDFEEKCVGLLRTYLVDCDGQLDLSDKTKLRDWIRAQSSSGQAWGTSQEDIHALIDKLE